MFALLDKATGAYYRDETGEIPTFETGKEASERAKVINEIHGTKYRCRPFVKEQVSNEWMTREQSRLESGE